MTPIKEETFAFRAVCLEDAIKQLEAFKAAANEWFRDGAEALEIRVVVFTPELH